VQPVLRPPDIILCQRLKAEQQANGLIARKGGNMGDIYNLRLWGTRSGRRGSEVHRIDIESQELLPGLGKSAEQLKPGPLPLSNEQANPRYEHQGRGATELPCCISFAAELHKGCKDGQALGE
jgi:hypothetical protein